MKAASISEIRKELKDRGHQDLVALCLRLAKFKKDNKELLTYLLYEADDESGYIRTVQEEMDAQFDQITTRSYYFIKKSVRKILRNLKKYIRYSGNKQTEVELLMYFCRKLKNMSPPMRRSTVLVNMYEGQIRMIRKAMAKLHEDLQFDYEEELAELV